jgi:hypothetical protein
LEHNHKLRPILDLLLNHNHIVQANLKPVALHWVETEKEKIEIESNNLLSDVSDVYDIDQRAAGKNFSHGSIPTEGNIVIDSGDKFQEESGRTLKNNSQGHTSLASDRSDMSDAKPTLLESKPTTTSAYSCYYCNDFQTNNQYELHVVSKHMLSPSDVNHLCYPCKLDLERLGLKAQRKNWEI